MGELVIIALLVIANGIFAGAEIAVLTVRAARMQELVDRGSSRARAVLALKNEPERFLATVQVGITVVGASAAAFGGASLAADLEPYLVGIPLIGKQAAAVAIGLVVAIVSYLSVVIGELVPKSLALRGAEQYALLIARPILVLAWLVRPIVWFLSTSANLVLRPFGDSTTFTEARHSAEELSVLVEEAARSRAIHPEAGEIASRVLDFPNLTAADVMVPRQQVVMIALSATPAEVTSIIEKHKFSRFPVYDQGVDDIVGYVNVRNLLVPALEARPLSLRDVLQKVHFVPESKRVVDLLRDMQQHVPIAVVVEEHGGTSGIVTIEDLLEEMVGEIFSEHVRPAPRSIAPEPTGSTLVQGTVPIRDINRSLRIELPEDGGFTTIGGLCMALAGRMPRSGDLLQATDGIRLQVVEATPRRVLAVRILLEPSEGEAPSSRSMV